LIFRRIALALAAAGCLAAAAAVLVVALGYALFAALRGPIGAPAASACVALAAALIIAIAGFVLSRAARVGRVGRRAHGGPANLPDALADLVRDRPVAAAALAAAVGFVLTRSPGLASLLGVVASRRDRR
jgi:hypothetical protein